LVTHSDTLTVLAWFSNDAGLQAQARRASERAIEAAIEAGHHDLAAYALAQLGLFHAHHLHDLQGALSLVDQGFAQGGRGTWKTRAWLSANRAEILSMMGDHKLTMATLETAQVCSEETTLPPPWLRVGFGDVNGYRGACAVRLGDVAEAMSALQTALIQRGTGPRICITLIDLGGAYALAREPEAACTVLGNALSIIEGQRSVAKFERVATVRPMLDLWTSEPFVRELDERIAETAAVL